MGFVSGLHGGLGLFCICLFFCSGNTTDLFVDPCAKGSSLVKKVFKRVVEEMERGVPRDIAAAFFAHFKSELGTWAIENCGEEAEMGKCCFTHDITMPLLTSQADLISIQNAVNDLVAAGHPPAYLSRSAYPNLPELPESISQEIITNWDTVRIFLDEPPKASYPVDTVAFPEIFTVLHDPNRAGACAEFDRWTSRTSQNLTATALTARVIGIVVRLHLIGVSQDDAFQILLHHAAFLFNAMRCTDKEDEHLYIPLAFSEIYSEAAVKLTAGLDTTAVPKMPDWIIEDHYDYIIRWITLYNAWGTKASVRVDVNGTVDFTTWQDEIFEPTRLDGVRTALASSRQVVPEMPISQTAQMLEIGNRHIGCQVGWVWEYRAKWKNSVEEQCCTQLCYDTALSESVLSDNIAGCCEFCNQVKCTCEHSYFDDYVAIVPAFGELEQQSVPLMI